jgi:hypothetical protein
LTAFDDAALFVELHPGAAGADEILGEVELGPGFVHARRPLGPHDRLLLGIEAVVGAAAGEDRGDLLVRDAGRRLDLPTDARPVRNLLGRTTALHAPGELR